MPGCAADRRYGVKGHCERTWNTFHTPVHSTYFIMDKTFYHMEHDDTVRKDIFKVMDPFFKEDANGKRVDPTFKNMKGEFVV
jgi:hypothetical protein